MMSPSVREHISGHSNTAKIQAVGRSACVTLCLLMVWGCGSRPAPIDQQARSLAKEIETAEQGAELGWLYYLAGRSESALSTFKTVSDQPLARLGLAQLAADRLDQPSVLDALRNIPPDGQIGRIAARWLQREEGSESVLTWSLHGSLNDGDIRVSMDTWTHIVMDLEKGELHANGRLIPLAKLRQTSQAYASIVAMPGAQFIEVSHDHAHGLWQSGRWLFRDHDSADQIRTLTIDASQPLLVIWSGTRAPRIQSYPTEGLLSGLNPIGPKVSGHDRSPNWVRRYLEVWDLIEKRQGDLAEVKLRSSPKSPAFAQLRARAQRFRPMMPSAVASDLEIQHWIAAREQAPLRAQRRLAELYRSTGDIDAAMDALKELRTRVQLDHRQIDTWVQVLDDSGRQTEALRFLNQHEKNPCAHTDLRLRTFNAGDPEPLARRLMTCGEPEMAIQFLMDLDTPELALKIVEEATLKPERRAFHRARALLAMGQESDAREALQGPLDIDGQILLYDLTWVEKNTSDFVERMQRLVTEHSAERQVIPFLAADPHWSPIASLEFDADTLIEKARRNATASSKTRRILNHSVLLFGKKGRYVRSVHEIIRIGSLNAAKEFGELGLPEDAVPIAIYARKSDGRTRYAEESPDKDSLTIPELEPGDFLVAHYIQPMGQESAKAEILSPHLFFGNFDLDTIKQRVDALFPKDMKMEIDTQRMTAEGHSKTHDERLTLHRTELEQIRGVPNEPRSPETEQVLPWIRFIHAHDPEQKMKTLQGEYLTMSAGSPLFTEWVRLQTDHVPQDQKIAVLLSAIRTQYTTSSTLLDQPVDRGLHDGVGHRALAMSAALRTLNVAHRLVLAKAQTGHSRSRHWDPNQYGFALIQLADNRWIDPTVDYGPIGYFPAPLAGSQGVVLWPAQDDGLEWVSLPKASPVADKRRVHVSLRLRAGGRFAGQVHDTLVGAEANFVGRAFANTPKDAHGRLANRMILNALPSAQVKRVSDPGEHSKNEALELKYTIEGRLDSPNRLGCFPIGPGQRFAPLKSRKSPLILGLPVDQETIIRLETKEAIRVNEEPIRLHHGPHTFERTVQRISGGLLLTCRLKVAGGVVQPSDYREFRAWAHQVDDLEYLKIEVGQTEISTSKTMHTARNAPAPMTRFP